MKILIQIIKNYFQQDIPGVLISFEHSNNRYYFNVPETFQRFIRQHNQKFQKGNKIFFTRMSTPYISGILGFMLTLYDEKSCFQTQIYGPRNSVAFFENLRFQIGFKILPFSFFDFGTQQYILGINTQEELSAFSRGPNFSKYFFKFEDYLNKNGIKKESINDARINISEKNTYKDANLSIIPVTLTSLLDPKQVLSYICICEKIQGRVNKALLVQHQVPKNLIKQLISQGEIILENNRVVRSSDIMEDTIPGPAVIIIDCPHPSYLQSLLMNKDLWQLFAQNINLKEVRLNTIIHLTPLNVVKIPEYTNFFVNFGDCEHIFTCSGLTDANVNSEYDFTFKHISLVNMLNKLLPEYFPRIDPLNDLKTAKTESISTLCPHLKVLKDQFKQHYHLTESKTQKVGYANVVHEPQTVDLIQDPIVLEDSQRDHYSHLEKDLSNVDPEIVFLGTGSMKPSSYRNVSSIFLRDPLTNYGILLDCGEGTYYQLMNHYGDQKEFEDILIKLKVIFITHLHSDHHLGMLNILYQRKELLKKHNKENEKVFLVLPFIMGKFISIYQQFTEELDCLMVFNQQLNPDESFKDLLQETLKKQKFRPDESLSKSPDLRQKVSTLQNKVSDDPTEEQLAFEEKMIEDYIGSEEEINFLSDEIIEQTNKNKELLMELLINYCKIKGFRTVPTIHCKQSYGIVITYINDIKISYSGDTRPSPWFIEASKNCDVMIHEATFPNNLQQNAEDFLHSTIKEAVESGIKANCWRVILTHFSQRMQKGVNEKSTTEKNEEFYENYLKYNTITAYDHLRSKVSQLKELPFYSKEIGKLFPSED